MRGYLVRRLLEIVPVLLILSVFLFALLRVLPGDPLTAFVGTESGALDPQQRDALRQRLGLNDPLPMQYLHWLADVARGDWGRSLIGRQPVADLIRDRLSVTLQLGGLAWVLAVTMGIPIGVMSALRRNTWLDVWITAAALSGIAVPNFVLGLLLIVLFGVYLQLLPTTGFVPLTQEPLEALRHLILPAIALGTGFMATIIRQTRSAMLEVLREDYIRTATAKGLPRWQVLWRHALRNAMLPVITVAGIQIGHLASGAIVTETLFGLPGVGRLVADAVLRNDYQTVQMTVLVLALFTIVANLVADIGYKMLDPRIRLG